MRAATNSPYAFAEFQNSSVESLLFEIQFIGSSAHKRAANEIMDLFTNIANEVHDHGASLLVSNKIAQVISKSGRR
jgi:hypothetical protein